MKLLLDTHVLLWALSDDKRLSDSARKLIEDQDNQVYYSIVSPWEIQLKHMKHPDKMLLDGEAFSHFCDEAGYYKLGININHIINLKSLVRSEQTPSHNDPFDRMLVSQAKTEKMTFMTHDSLIPYYNEECILSI